MKLASIFAISLQFCALQVLAGLEGEYDRLRKTSSIGVLWSCIHFKGKKRESLASLDIS